MEYNNQTVYICFDDSGKIDKNNKFLIYSGLIFTNKDKYSNFKRKYKFLLNNIKKDNYYNNINEIKGFNILDKDRKRLLRLINKELTFSLIIDNDRLYPYITKDKKSRGRYKEYALKLTIKQIFVHLINSKKLNPYNNITLIINRDEEATASNAYYSLEEGITEEFLHGIQNFNYNKSFKPILFGEFKVVSYMQQSINSYAIQGADILANSVWRNEMQGLRNINLKYIDILNLLP